MNMSCNELFAFKTLKYDNIQSLDQMKLFLLHLAFIHHCIYHVSIVLLLGNLDVDSGIIIVIVNCTNTVSLNIRSLSVSNGENTLCREVSLVIHNKHFKGKESH